MPNCKVALKDHTEALEVSEDANIWDLCKINQTINRPELSQMLHHLQIQISAPSVSLFHTSTAFRMFILIIKIEINAHLVERQAHKSSDRGNRWASSPPQSPNAIITTRWAPAEGRCCGFFAARSIKLLSNKKWHWDIIFHLLMIVSVPKGVVRLGRGPCSQPDSTQVKLVTSSQSSVAITAFLWREKQSCTVQVVVYVNDVNVEKMFWDWS